MSFDFKEEWAESIDALPDNDSLAVYRAVCAYFLYGAYTALAGDAKAVYERIIGGKDDMEEVFKRWLSYKKAKRQTYKTHDSMQTAFKRLVKYSGGDPEVASEIIDQAIGNNYAGFFPLKNQRVNNGDREFANRIWEKLSCPQGY